MHKCIKKNLIAAVMSLGLAATSVSALADTPAVNNVAGDLSVMVLGSGGPQIMPAGKASAGYLIFADGKPCVLMDLGSGTYKSLAMSGAHIGQVNYILLSHLHIDHASEVPGVIKGIYFDGQLTHNQHVDPIQVYGPNVDAVGMFPSTSQLMDGYFAQGTGLFRYLRAFVGGVDGRPDIIGKFGYNAYNLDPTWDINNLQPSVIPVGFDGYPGPVVDGSQVLIKEIAVDHYEAPAIAYKIQYKGYSIVYSGDTHSTSDNMVRLAKGADILIYDTSILDNVPNPASPFAKRHTIPSRIGQVAAEAGVKTLVLSHLTPVTLPNVQTVVIPEIRAAGYTGNISVATDLKVYNLGTN